MPAENTWTHTLLIFQKTLLREAVSGLGGRCWPRGRSTAEEATASAHHTEAFAGADYHKNLHTTRKERSHTYSNDPDNIHELAPLTVYLEVADTCLLYPMMGNKERPKEDGPTKVDMLLDPDKSNIGECGKRLLALLDLRCLTTSHGDMAIIETLGSPHS